MRSLFQGRNTFLSGAALLLFILIINERTLGQHPCGSIVPTDSVLRKGQMGATGVPLTMLAFGTSLMWGNGLKEPDTFRYKVADWVETQSGRPVQLTTFAHSAALLSPPPLDSSVGVNTNPSIGDLNNALPSVDDQIECAADSKSFRNADLVLVEGCINEVGAESIVYPWTLKDDLTLNTNTFCGDPFLTELQKIQHYFPNAIVVAVGYYPLVSNKSSIFGFSGTRRLASHATKVYLKTHPSAIQLQSKRRPRREERSILVDNSEAFYQNSKNSIISAVNRANSSGQSQVFFAQMPEPAIASNGLPTMDPLFAYGARRGHQWMISFRVLYFWAFYKDDKYWFRQPLCKKYVSAGDIPGLIDRLVCQTNPAFHPNTDGADVYAKSIEAAIPTVIISKWKSGHL